MSKELLLSSIPQMNVGMVVDSLTKVYTAVISGKMPMSKVPSVMLWGPPGIGKSQAVRELAERLEKDTKKTVRVTDVRLLLFNPIDLRGIPTANEDKTLAVWLKPQIFQMDPSENVINILFLDEISAAPQSVQAAAYQITLDRVVGEHRLPDNTIVIAAGNRTTDKSVAVKMPKALANRLMHFEVESNFDSWNEWAVSRGINSKVLGFLKFRNDFLMNFDAQVEDLAYATPRSWEMVSNLLNYVDDDIANMYQMIAGLVGVGVATEFMSWDRVMSKLPNIESIFEGKCPKMPDAPDALYAMCSSMLCYAREHKNDIKKISNSIDYALRMPPDFSVMLMKDYMLIDEDFRIRLLKIPSFSKWLSTRGDLLNGRIK